MSSTVRRNSHLSRYFAALRQQRGFKPGPLAARLCASNESKVGSLIRAFELGEPLSDHWLQKLVAELKPDSIELRRCLGLDQAEAAEQLERERMAWEAWADEPIEPFLSIRYGWGSGLTRKVPRAFCNSREQAEGWAADQLKRCPHKSHLTWTRRQGTAYDEHGLSPRRWQVSFGDCMTAPWMQLSESQQKFLLGDAWG